MITLFLFSFLSDSQANWKKSSGNPPTPHSNSDSLPEGVTKDWLNDLRDETGNKIFNDNISRTPGQIPEETEGDALQRKIFNGFSSNSLFGYSVSSAGDVNGDGFDDIAIGAYGYNSNAGRAYIYYGGLNMNTVPDVVLSGGLTGSLFGFSVASAGDVNGDGFSDVIVGGYGYSSNTGRTYIFFGGSTMNNSVDVFMTGEAVNNQFGYSVSSAGDVNSDGYADVVVGANRHNSYTGRAYIFYGGASMNSAVDITMNGESANSTFGTSVSLAGDVNSDGYEDVIVGANGFSSNTGRGYVFFGGNSMDNTADVVMTGEAANNNFGVSVSSAGDINGDGFADVLIGAYGYNSNTGKTYIYFGGTNMNPAADVSIIGESAFNYFGNSVSSAGDVNGDGFSDVIIGAFGYTTLTGKVYVYFGGTSMDTISDITMTGETTNSSFGISVSSAGDINADGYSDLIAGANGYNSNTGRVYFYDYFMKNVISPEIIINGEAVNNNFGSSVSSAGDVNADGYSDIVIGARNSSVTGKAYIYYGGLSADNIADVTMTGEGSSFFGASVSSAGDVNGDGYSDVIISAYLYNSSTGRVYIFYGGSPMNNTADVIMTGESVNNYFGSCVSSAGDVNADGFSDVIVGARGFNSSDGKVYVYYGGESMNNTADRTFSGNAVSGEYFGSSVSSAGDVNGDGYSDMIVGAYAHNSYTGRATLYYGGSNAKLEFSGISADDFFGISVSSAGDINADGYSDIVIGAHGTASDAGRAYIFLGGVFMNNTADVVITGNDGFAFGRSVSTAGDINADGYSDVIIGSVDVGRTDIFLGGENMDNISDVSMTREFSAYDGFGYSVSSAGDINGDGYSDVIVGAEEYGSVTGRVYLYKGSSISVQPILLHAKDVPNDQGGKIDLKWARSANDVQGNSLITDYLVQRSLPPSGGNFSWQNVTSIPATHESFYFYIDLTPSDSTANGSSTLFYRITARTNSINQSWRSNILSGRSLDNISPPVVSPFSAFSESVNVRLTWKRNSAPDLLNYVLFRSSSPSIDPYTETPLTSLSDSTFLDTDPLNGLYYYFIVAQDIHNNLSPVAVAQSPVDVKNLILFGAIQGMYNAVSNTMLYDTVTVYLRNAYSPFAKADSSKKLLYGPGTGQEFTFINAQNNVPYYIEVKHRNALETWSADPVTFIGNNASIAFSVDDIYAYGNNEIQVDNDPYNVFAFYSGDVNQDGVIDGTDTQLIDNDAFNFSTGYIVTDLNGDEIIDGSDALFAANNAANFVSAVTP